MGRAIRLTEDKNYCPHCKHVESKTEIENRLYKNSFSVTLICDNCKTSVEYYYSANGFINCRYALKRLRTLYKQV